VEDRRTAQLCQGSVPMYPFSQPILAQHWLCSFVDRLVAAAALQCHLLGGLQWFVACCCVWCAVWCCAYAGLPVY
jgi:hypothetical protein